MVNTWSWNERKWTKSGLDPQYSKLNLELFLLTVIIEDDISPHCLSTELKQIFIATWLDIRNKLKVSDLFTKKDWNRYNYWNLVSVKVVAPSVKNT
jgi:hypothetical protein